MVHPPVRIHAASVEGLIRQASAEPPVGARYANEYSRLVGYDRNPAETQPPAA